MFVFIRIEFLFVKWSTKTTRKMSTLYVRNAVKFLRSSGFLSKVESAVDLNQLDQLSTFGLLFKSNLLRLLHQLDRHSLFPVFPAARLGHLDESLSARLLTNCSLTSNQTISSSSLQAQPFALRTDQINSSSSLITSIGDLSWNCDHQQSLAVYCASSHALNTFQWMQSSRHRLWRSVRSNFLTYFCFNLNRIHILSYSYRNFRQIFFWKNCAQLPNRFISLSSNFAKQILWFHLKRYRTKLWMIICFVIPIQICPIVM